jgi:hypothetical protein
MVEHLSALSGLCTVLSRRELTEEHLAQLQRTVENLHDAAALSTFARQTRGLVHETLLQLREGSLDPLKLLPRSFRGQPMTWRKREL